MSKCSDIIHAVCFNPKHRKVCIKRITGFDDHNVTLTPWLGALGLIGTKCLCRSINRWRIAFRPLDAVFIARKKSSWPEEAAACADHQYQLSDLYRLIAFALPDGTAVDGRVNGPLYHYAAVTATSAVLLQELRPQEELAAPQIKRHAHQYMSQWIHCVAGELVLSTEGPSPKRETLIPGESCFINRGTVHSSGAGKSGALCFITLDLCGIDDIGDHRIAVAR